MEFREYRVLEIILPIKEPLLQSETWSLVADILPPENLSWQ